MAVWVVRLSGDEFELKELCRSTKLPELTIKQEDSTFILESSFFNELQDAGEIKQKVDDLLLLINGSMRLALGSRTPVEVEAVIHINNNGAKVTTCFHEDIMYGSAISSHTITRVNGSIEEFHPADPIPGWMILANSNEIVQKVLRLFGKGVNNWVSLYRVYEVIKHDMGGDANIVGKEWTTQRQIDRFRRTANSVVAAGDDSRHGVETNDPPQNPMSLPEAISFIEYLVHNWIRWKQSEVQ